MNLAFTLTLVFVVATAVVQCQECAVTSRALPVNISTGLTFDVDPAASGVFLQSFMVTAPEALGIAQYSVWATSNNMSNAGNPDIANWTLLATTAELGPFAAGDVVDLELVLNFWVPEGEQQGFFLQGVMNTSTFGTADAAVGELIGIQTLNNTETGVLSAAQVFAGRVVTNLTDMTGGPGAGLDGSICFTLEPVQITAVPTPAVVLPPPSPTPAATPAAANEAQNNPVVILGFPLWQFAVGIAVIFLLFVGATVGLSLCIRRKRAQSRQQHFRPSMSMAASNLGTGGIDRTNTADYVKQTSDLEMAEVSRRSDAGIMPGSYRGGGSYRQSNAGQMSNGMSAHTPSVQPRTSMAGPHSMGGGRPSIAGPPPPAKPVPRKPLSPKPRGSLQSAMSAGPHSMPRMSHPGLGPRVSSGPLGGPRPPTMPQPAHLMNGGSLSQKRMSMPGQQPRQQHAPHPPGRPPPPSQHIVDEVRRSVAAPTSPFTPGQNGWSSRPSAANQYNSTYPAPTTSPPPPTNPAGYAGPLPVGTASYTATSAGNSGNPSRSATLTFSQTYSALPPALPMMGTVSQKYNN